METIAHYIGVKILSAISAAFRKAKANGNGALVGYITAGDPSLELTPKIADALINGGIDVLELGLPFSDPIADGPAEFRLQACGLWGLEQLPGKVLEIAKEIRMRHDVPIAVMTYYNPVFKNGPRQILRLSKRVPNRRSNCPRLAH